MHHGEVVLVGVLGPIELRDADGNPVPLRSARQRCLLAALALDANRPVLSDVLAARLWGDDLPDDPAAALQTNVARLRRALPIGVDIVTESRAYRLAVARGDLDVTAFEDALAERRPADALGLWRGRPYPDLDADDALAEAVRLDELRAAAVEQRAASAVDGGRASEAVAPLEALLAEQPLRESAAAVLMRALAAAGRQSDALRVFSRLRRQLAAELGIEPSAAVRVVEDEILRQAPAAAPAGRRASPPLLLPVSSFIGRDPEVAQVGERLAAARVVTLCGPGGVGKTRLARHAAHAVADRYDDGVVAVDLSATADGRDIQARVAAALRVTAAGETALLDRIVEVCLVRHQLLVLDDCEHVLEPVAELVEAVTTHAPGVDVLTTSREPLRVDGEHVVAVAPLAAEHAVALLRDRVAAVAPQELRDGTESGLADIAQRLDGLPLALELAAASVPAFGVAGLVGALDESLDVLRHGRRTAGSRHRSLQHMVAWSYALLNEPERDLFQALSVFAGSVDADAVAAVSDALGGRGPTQAVLADLVDRSLVYAMPGPPRAYGMLGVVRAYGRELLAGSSRGLDLRDRHARWALGLAETVGRRMHGPDEAAAAAMVDARTPDLARAMSWLADQKRVEELLEVAVVLAVSGFERLRADLVQLADDVVTVVGDARHAVHARLLGTVACIRWQRGDFTGAEELGNRGVRIADAVAPDAARDAEQALANVAYFRGDFETSRRHSQRGIELCAAAGDLPRESSSRLDLAMTEAYAGRPESAAEQLAEGRRIAEALGSPRLLGWAAYTEGEILAEQAPDQAAPHLERAVALAESVGADFLATVARHTLLTMAGRRGGVRLDEYAHLIDDWHRSGAWTQLWVATRALIEALAREERFADAVRLIAAGEVSTTAVAPFGRDRERLADVAGTARAALGTAYDAIYAEGVALGDEGAVALARRLAQGPPA